jgi:acyl-ACP thioesterase
MNSGTGPRPRLRRCYRVRSYETDPNGRLQVPILCKLLQEAATDHAAQLGVAVESLIELGVAWVLNHLRLRVERWPGADAEVVIETWPEAADRLFTERRFEVATSAGESVATASTLWLVMDLERRRPVRLPPIVVDALSRHELGSRPMRPPRLEESKAPDRELEFTVRRSDLDLAGHVNNTSYVEWAVEAVCDRVWAASELAELDISYLSECRPGQTVVSSGRSVRRGSAVEISHQLQRRDDGTAVARGRTVWR